MKSMTFTTTSNKIKQLRDEEPITHKKLSLFKVVRCFYYYNKSKSIKWSWHVVKCKYNGDTRHTYLISMGNLKIRIAPFK